MRSCKQAHGVHFVIGYQLSCRYLVKSISQQDIDLPTTMFQIPHGMGGYGMTPNVIAQISAKVVMVSRFLAFVGSLSCLEQPFNSSSMVHKSNCGRPRHLDVVSLDSTQTGMQKARRRFQLWYSRIYHGPRPASSPVKHTSFDSPHKPSFGYFTQYGRYLRWTGRTVKGTVKGSTTVSTNFISSTHEGMTSLANKHCHCLKYTDAWTISSSHSDD
jgi:hypothetical protein